MRHSPAEVKKRLLSALDEDSNVIDMAVVLDVVTILEQLPISREALETTRLGKHINDLRKKTQDPALAKRAKALVRRWRDMIIPASAAAAATTEQSAPPVASKKGSPPAASPHSYPSSANTSPCMSRSTTPGLSKLSPGLARTNTLQPISPAASTQQSANSPPPEQAPDKADVANKRKRKAEPAEEVEEQRPEKRQRFNGVPPVDECSRDSISGEIIAEVAVVAATPAAKKPRRPRSAIGAPSFDDLTEKLASVARTPRVKTTRQLLSDLAERSGDSALARRASQFPQLETPPAARRHPPPPHHELSRNKSAHMEKFLNSQSGKRRGRPPLSRPAATGNGGTVPIETIDLEDDDEPTLVVAEAPSEPAPEPKPEAEAPPKPWPSEAEILARLPPLNEAEIVWSDDDPDAGDAPAAKPKPLEPARLSDQHLENINGNTNHEGVFKEWHEVVTASVRDGEVLPMLPYVMVD